MVVEAGVVVVGAVADCIGGPTGRSGRDDGVAGDDCC